MSDSVPPHRRGPTRLHHPWDSPGNNARVGCHVLLQCMKVKRESEVTQSCPTLSDPMDCSLPGSSVHGICQARVLEWGAIAFSALVVQWIEIHLSVQGTWVQSLVREDPSPGGPHMPWGSEACSPQLLSPCSRAWEPQLVSPRA